MWDLSLVLFFALCAAYILPWAIAGTRGHHQTMAIGVLNLFLGWTLLGWVAALVWSCTAIPVHVQAVSPMGDRP